MKRLFLGAALLAMGNFAMAQQTQPSMAQKAEREAKRVEMQKKQEERRAQHLAEMQKELNLSQTQMDRMRAMQERNAVKRRGEMQRNQELRKQKMEAKRQQHQNEMKQILTPEQYKKWEANRQAKMQERREKFQNRKDDFGGMKNHKNHKNLVRPNAS